MSKKTFIKTLYNSSISFVYVVIEEKKQYTCKKMKKKLLNIKIFIYFYIAFFFFSIYKTKTIS